MTRSNFVLASLLSVGPALTGCTVRAMGRPVPVVVHATIPVRSAPPPRPVYYAQPTYQAQPAYQPPPAQPPQPASCIDPGDRDVSDLFDRAMPLDGNSTTIGCTATSDADMFQVTVPPAGAGQVVRYALRGQTAMAPIIEIYDVNRRKVHHHSGSRSQELQGWVHVAGGTLIYVRISQIHSGLDAYSLAMTAGPLAEPGEPNGAIEKATLIPPSGTITGFMGNTVNDPTATDDWYRIDVTNDGPLAFDIDMSQGVAPIAEIYDANRKKIARQTGGSSERIRVRTANVHRGTYFLRISSIHRLDDSGKGDLPPTLARPYSITLSR